MKPENIILKIAEACGWKNHDHPDCMAKKVGWTMPEKWCMRPDGELVFNHARPDYLNDLNATHDMKKTLTDEQRPIYWRTLYEVCKTTEWPFNAEAHQEAEAFLRAINKWEES